MKRFIDYYLPLCLLAGLVLGWGCTSEEIGTNKGTLGNGEMLFSLSLPESSVHTRALSASAETEIKTLDILVFKEVSPGQEVFDYRIPVTSSSISTGSPRQFRTKVKLLSERQNFVLLANAGDEVNLLSAAGQNKEEVLKALTITNNGKWNVGTNYRALPLWGETGWVSVNTPSAVLPGPVTLYRMQAKIDLHLSATAQTKFRLKEIYLFKHNTRGRLVPEAANWSSGTAIAASLPALPQPVATPSWRYDSSDGVTTTSAQNLVYLFETKAKNSGTPTDEFAVVVGGNYSGNSALSYYRIDIKNASHTAYADVLRNYRYDIEIADVANAGATTPEAAFLGENTLNVTVSAWNLSAQNTTIDPVQTLRLDSTVALLDWKGSLLRFGVNSTKLWTLGATLNGVDFRVGPTYIELEGDGSVKNNSRTTELDCGCIDIRSGNIEYRLNVRMAPAPSAVWAGSNIYWDGTKLTFTDVDDQSKSHYQGVFFLWGSLWGIDPRTYYFSGSGGLNDITLYAPDGSTGLIDSYIDDWYVSFPSIPSLSSVDLGTGDEFYLYNNHNPSAGIGDICRHLTEKGWAPGAGKKWRMPTSSEFEIGSDNFVFAALPWNDQSSLDNRVGTYYVNKGVTSGELGHPFFPASGYLWGMSGAREIGKIGGYHSSSSNGGLYNCSSFTFGIHPETNMGFLNFSSTIPRSYGFPIRCVQE